LKEASGTRTTTKRSNVPRKASQKIVVISNSKDDRIECLNNSKDNGIICLNNHKDDEIECLDDSKDNGIECLNGHKDDKIERLNDREDDTKGQVSTSNSPTEVANSRFDLYDKEVEQQIYVKDLVQYMKASITTGKIYFTLRYIDEFSRYIDQFFPSNKF
jgi:recombination DNA repair RAD52 pathway protein